MSTEAWLRSLLFEELKRRFETVQTVTDDACNAVIATIEALSDVLRDGVENMTGLAEVLLHLRPCGALWTATI